MESTFKAADEGDVALLLEMMREFYVHERIAFNEQAAQSALRQMLEDDSLGHVYLILCGADVAGYIVLTFGFSLEFHGRDALVDELYIREDFRGRGIGKRGLQFIEGVCRELGIRALHLAVERANAHAQAVYRKTGFVEHDRYVMTKWVE